MLRQGGRGLRRLRPVRGGSRGHSQAAALLLRQGRGGHGDQHRERPRGAVAQDRHGAADVRARRRLRGALSAQLPGAHRLSGLCRSDCKRRIRCGDQADQEQDPAARFDRQSLPAPLREGMPQEKRRGADQHRAAKGVRGGYRPESPQLYARRHGSFGQKSRGHRRRTRGTDCRVLSQYHGSQRDRLRYDGQDGRHAALRYPAVPASQGGSGQGNFDNRKIRREACQQRQARQGLHRSFFKRKK